MVVVRMVVIRLISGFCGVILADADDIALSLPSNLSEISCWVRKYILTVERDEMVASLAYFSFVKILDEHLACDDD